MPSLKGLGIMDDADPALTPGLYHGLARNLSPR